MLGFPNDDVLAIEII